MTRHSEILKLHDEAREQYDTAKKTLDELPADADEGVRKEAFEKFDAAMRAIDEKMERAQKMQELDAKDAELNALHGLSAGQIEDRSKDLSAKGKGTSRELTPEQAENRYMGAFVDYLRGFSSNDELRMEESRKIARDAMFAQSVPAAMGLEQRDVLVANANQGGVLIPTQLLTTIYEYMAYYGCMNNDSLFTVLRTTNGNTIEFPRLSQGEATSEAVSSFPRATETTQVADGTDPTFDKMTLGAYAMDSGVIKVSWDFIQDAPQGGGFVNTFLRDIIAERMGRKINGVLTTGTGSSEPQGLVPALSAAVFANGNATAGAATGLTADEWKEVQHSIDIAYRDQPGVRWMFNDDVYLSLRKLKDGDGNYIWDEPNLRAGTGAQVLGKGICINNKMDGYGTSGEKPIVYGDLKKFYIRYALGMRIRTLDELFALYLQVGIFAYTRLDSDLIDNTAIKVVVLP